MITTSIRFQNVHKDQSEGQIGWGDWDVGLTIRIDLNEGQRNFNVDPNQRDNLSEGGKGLVGVKVDLKIMYLREVPVTFDLEGLVQDNLIEDVEMMEGELM